MAEAILGFGLAANVFQFISIGSHLVSRVNQLHSSSRSGVGDLLDLKQITLDVDRIAKDLQAPQSQTFSQSEQGFCDLAERCQTVATELLQLLAAINGPEQPRRRDAFKTAFLTLFKESQVKSLQIRLDGFRQELTLNLLVSLRYVLRGDWPPLRHLVGRVAYEIPRDHSRRSLDQQQMILNRLKPTQSDTKELGSMVDAVTANTETLGSALVTFLASKLGSTHTEKVRLERSLVSAMYQDSEEATNTMVQPNVSTTRRDKMVSRILRQFRYESMEDREERVAEAYEETFNWIFEDNDGSKQKWSNFKDWLESDDQLYWITGKPGSGKSTLMKFICKDESPTESATSGARYFKYLEKWAESSTILTGTFYFWNSGTQEQMSWRGLLQTLLFQIIHQCPELTPMVLPNAWETMCLFDEFVPPFGEKELKQTLRNIAKHKGAGRKLCLFIDGLDEFSGNLNELLFLLKGLTDFPDVKLCIASRPWVEMEKAFQHHPSMMLQDLTYNDIKHFVTSSLHNDHGFAQLQRRESAYANQLVENIISKASGVFLWVQLVVVSLLSGMSYGDRVSDLQRRLDILPPDLERLYDNILENIDPFYLEHAAQFFALIQNSYEPPALLQLQFADEADSESILANAVAPIPDDELVLGADTMRLRLNSRCKGLLEASYPSESSASVLEVPDLSKDYEPNRLTVQYLHRTVKDFIETDEVQQKLQVSMKAPFDPHLQLMLGLLGQMKALDSRRLNFIDTGLFWSCIRDCLFSASQIQPRNRKVLVALLDELDKTCSALVKEFATNRSTVYGEERRQYTDSGSSPLTEEDLMAHLYAGRWVYSIPRPLYAQVKHTFGFTFLSLVVHYGITEYVESKANFKCLVQKWTGNGANHPPNLESWPLLADATLHNLDWQRFFRSPEPLVKMVLCLLRKGADPCYKIKDHRPTTDASSPFVRALGNHMRLLGKSDISKHPSAKIIELMLNRGALLYVDDIAKIDSELYSLHDRNIKASDIYAYYCKLTGKSVHRRDNFSPWKWVSNLRKQK